MKVIIGKQEIDYFDDEAIRSAAMSHAIAMTHMVKGRHLRKGLEGLFCDVYTLFIKAQGLLFFSESRSHKFLEVESLRQLVEYMRAILGEAPCVNDSVIVPEPPKPDIEVKLVMP